MCVYRAQLYHVPRVHHFGGILLLCYLLPHLSPGVCTSQFGDLRPSDPRVRADTQNGVAGPKTSHIPSPRFSVFFSRPAMHASAVAQDLFHLKPCCRCRSFQFCLSFLFVYLCDRLIVCLSQNKITLYSLYLFYLSVFVRFPSASVSVVSHLGYAYRVTMA